MDAKVSPYQPGQSRESWAQEDEEVSTDGGNELPNGFSPGIIPNVNIPGLASKVSIASLAAVDRPQLRPGPTAWLARFGVTRSFSFASSGTRTSSRRSLQQMQRRTSGFAVDLNIRADLRFEETLHLLEVAFEGNSSELAANGSWRFRMQKVVFSRGVARFLRAVGLLGTFLAPLLLALEPSCQDEVPSHLFGRIPERAAVAAIKWVHVFLSTAYFALSLGQMLMLNGEPVLAILRYFSCRSSDPSASMEINEKLTHAAGKFHHVVRKDRRFRSLEWLVLDLTILVSLPAELVHLFHTPVDVPSFVQWLWFLNAIKVWRFLMPTTERRDSQDSFWMQIVHLAVSLFLFTHICACVFVLATMLEAGHGMTSWKDTVEELPGCSDFYMASFYFAAYTVTSIGYGDITPMNTLERGIDSFIMIVSQMYVAKVFADLNFIIGTHNYWRAQKHQRLKQTAAALKSMGAPRTIRQRTFAYQDFVWEVQKERRAKDCLRDLSENLQQELQAVVYQRLVTQAPFLQQLSVTALRHIISSLSDIVNLPSDYIIRRGAAGSELYFLREGSAGVFLGVKAPRWDDQEVKIVQGGDYFGEVALLTGQKRSSWVMARTYCVCALLHKRAIDEVMVADPSCIHTLTYSMKNELGLQARTTWQEVGNRLNKVFVDLGELQHFFHREAKTANGSNPMPDLRSHIAWSQYQALMHQIRVPILDQKLLWIDLEGTESGFATFQNFVEVVYGGARCEEAADLLSEALGDGEPGTQRHSESFRPSQQEERSGSQRSVERNPSWSGQHLVGQRHAQQEDMSKELQSQISIELQSQISILGDRLEQRIDSLGDRLGQRIDSLEKHVAEIREHMAPPARAPDGPRPEGEPVAPSGDPADAAADVYSSG